MIERKHRVKKSNEFQKIIHSQQVEKNQSFIIYYSVKEINSANIGISVSKKLGNAVLRNKIKRQVRHLVKEKVDLSKNVDMVIVVRANYKRNIFLDNQKLLDDLVKRIWRKIDEQN